MESSAMAFRWPRHSMCARCCGTSKPFERVHFAIMAPFRSVNGRRVLRAGWLIFSGDKVYGRFRDGFLELKEIEATLDASQIVA